MASIRAAASRTIGNLNISTQQSRRQASSLRNVGNANWPLGLAVAGAVGLGAYVYLDRMNPEKVAKRKADLEGKAKAAASQVQAAVEAPAASGALIKDQWTAFTLRKVEPHNHNTQIYHFDFPEESREKTSGIPVAGALLVKSAEGENEVRDEKGKPVIRPYTPISTPEQTGYLTLMIKEYKDGKLTSHISRLEPGKSQLMFKGPILKYKYEPNQFDRGLCISGGSGITPMWQLINYSLSLPDDRTKWTLVFSNVSDKDILLKKEWDQLAQAHPGRLDVKYVVDKAPRGWTGETGFVTAPMLAKLFPRDAQRDDKVKAFVCGPPPQVNSICGPKDGPRQGELQGALKELGYSADEVFKF